VVVVVLVGNIGFFAFHSGGSLLLFCLVGLQDYETQPLQPLQPLQLLQPLQTVSSFFFFSL
jgi:hypothetical protein